MSKLGRRNFLRGAAAAVGATVLLPPLSGDALVAIRLEPADPDLAVAAEELDYLSYDTLSISAGSTVLLGSWTIRAPVLLPRGD